MQVSSGYIPSSLLRYALSSQRLGFRLLLNLMEAVSCCSYLTNMEGRLDWLMAGCFKVCLTNDLMWFWGEAVIDGNMPLEVIPID